MRQVKDPILVRLHVKTQLQRIPARGIFMDPSDLSAVDINSSDRRQEWLFVFWLAVYLSFYGVLVSNEMSLIALFRMFQLYVMNFCLNCKNFFLFLIGALYTLSLKNIEKEIHFHL